MSEAAPQFTLVAVTSRDGFITGPNREPPASWASPEEQVVFAETVSALGWSFTGRITHELAWRPARRRVVFSRSCPTPLWRHPARLWVDPERTSLEQILDMIREVHPADHCGILGGVAVHDWFAAHRLIDAAELTVEPLTFSAGLPLLSGRAGQDPIATLEAIGLRRTDTLELNARGTRLYRFVRAEPRASTPAGS
jgi:dihydrofolate reductase